MSDAARKYAIRSLTVGLVMLPSSGCQSLAEAVLTSAASHFQQDLEQKERKPSSTEERQARTEEACLRQADLGTSFREWREQQALEESLRETDQSWFRVE